jgi:diguanylate cyclase
MSPTTPADLSTSALADAAGHPRVAGLPLALGIGLLVLGAAGVAAVLAFASVRWAAGAAAGTAGWAALAAALGVVLAGLPLALALRRLVAQLPALPDPPNAVDPSTGAATRSVLLDVAGREWSRSRRYGTGAAVLLIEIDRYARLCEARGSDAGEAVLRELARQTAPSLRGADVLSRFGGAQLAVFLVQADATGALDVAERIRERAEQLEVPWHPQRLRLTASIGVAHLRPAHQSVPALMDDAADALQAAREAGGNCVRAAPVDRGDTLPLRGLPRDDQRTRPS